MLAVGEVKLESGTEQSVHPPEEHIFRGRTTRGTETSKYPEEKKSTTRSPE